MQKENSQHKQKKTHFVAQFGFIKDIPFCNTTLAVSFPGEGAQAIIT